ncbi:MAG: serine hydrolase [Clostridiales bacterium]|nr:serine hydrolase [Clostridiales bacterium]
MKRPNPTFLTKAVEIKEKRHNRIKIAIIVIAVLSLLTIFVIKVASMQQVYRERFPELVGAGTATAAETAESSESSEQEEIPVTETAEASEETTEDILAPVVVQDDEPTEETTASEETEQNNAPDVFVESDPVYFSDSYPLQTISHEDRDVELDQLKQDVINYMDLYSNERICFRYVNLSSNETLGINDLDPIVPGGAITLPVSIAYYERIDKGWTYPTSVVTYQGEEAPEGSSYIADTYEAGKQFYLRTCANLAVTMNDNLALQYMLDSMGGLENNWSAISSISSYINYTDSVIYTDFEGELQRGPHRTSAYDLAAYAEYLYTAYINDPDLYQPLINDLAASEKPTGIRTAFGEDTLILHMSGTDVEYSAYTDVAIIDAEEPVILVIYCECSSADRAATIQADLATYLARYLTYCHS